MTTVTIADHTITFDGHADDRDVCISLSSLSQALAAILKPQYEDKRPGYHQMSYADLYVIPEHIIIKRVKAHLESIAAKYPENLKVIDDNGNE